MNGGLVDDLGDPDRGPRAGWLARIAHLTPAVIVVYGVFCVLEWLEIVRVEEWGPVGAVVLIVPICVVLIVSQVHQVLARLCLRCMESVRADAPVRVRRHRWQLWLAHWLGPVWRYVLVIGGLTAAVYAVRAVLDLPTGAATWIRAPLDVLLLSYFHAEWLHHRYRPWCPYCKPWDGGGGMHERSPDPTDSGTKVA